MEFISRKYFFIYLWLVSQVLSLCDTFENDFYNYTHSKNGSRIFNHERILIGRLLHDYDNSVRPILNSSLPLNVTFGLSLTQIIDVDERNQILTTSCWLNQMWIDHGLRWNSSEYGGLKVIRIPFEKVWRPDIILYNNADSKYNLAILSTNVIVSSDGNLTWLSSAIYKSACQINVEYFPFDEQNCTMKFASWTYGGYQVNLIIGTEEGDLSNYVQNGEWDLITMKVKRKVHYYSCCSEPYPEIIYTIVLRRRPLFYVFNLILPCVLISALALMSFYMPSDSGEKVTLGITTLLSMTVFLMVIGESMPPTSEKLPLIGLYYGVTISLVSFATGLSVVTLNMHHRGMKGLAIPRCIRFFIFNFLAKILFIQFQNSAASESEDSKGKHPCLCSPHCSRIKLTGCPESQKNKERVGAVFPQIQGLQPLSRGSTSRLSDWQSHSSGDLIFPGSSTVSGIDCLRGKTQMSGIESEAYDGERPIMRVRGVPSNARGTCHFCSGRRETDDSEFPSSEKTTCKGRDCNHSQCMNLLKLLDRMNQHFEQNDVRMNEDLWKDKVKLEWQQAALVIDRLLLWIFAVATVAATFGILYMSPHTKLFST